MRSTVFRLSADAADRRCFYYFLMAVIVIRYETTATARWTSPFIVRAFFNNTITVAVWTGFHARLTFLDLPRPEPRASAIALPSHGKSFLRACPSHALLAARTRLHFGGRTSASDGIVMPRQR